MHPVLDDRVVLLDPEGRPSGTAERSTVHSERTPLHLAFSCYLVSTQSQVLLTRRALTKRTWPGVWTNSCCGHPWPGEPMDEAVARRVREELGVTTGSIRPLLPDFRYEAVDASGIREHEVCPVFVADVDSDLDPNPAEVMEIRWVDPTVLGAVARSASWLLSPWCVDQVRRLDLTQLTSNVPAHGG